MRSYSRFAIALSVCAFCISAIVAQEAPVKQKCTVELRWVENKRIEGVTENQGFQCSCDPNSIVYPHKKPALVLTAAEVSEAKLIKHDFSKNGLSGDHYTVKLILTKDAREKLAATCKSNDMQLLTITVDGRNWGVHRYEKDKDKPFVPTAARADTFEPSVGFISSQQEAEKLADTFK